MIDTRENTRTLDHPLARIDGISSCLSDFRNEQWDVTSDTNGVLRISSLIVFTFSGDFRFDALTIVKFDSAEYKSIVWQSIVLFMDAKWSFFSWETVDEKQNASRENSHWSNLAIQAFRLSADRSKLAEANGRISPNRLCLIYWLVRVALIKRSNYPGKILDEISVINFRP